MADIGLILLIIAFALLVVDAFLRRSTQSAGLAFAIASLLVEMV